MLAVFSRWALLLLLLAVRAVRPTARREVAEAAEAQRRERPRWRWRPWEEAVVGCCRLHLLERRELLAVRVRLASGIGGRTAVRARATATTMRASAFGHATMFVMGCVLAIVTPESTGVISRCSCGSRGRTDQEVARKRHASP